MENVFRTKKYRDTTLRAKTHDVVSGTLDSIHQSFVSGLFDKNKDDLKLFGFDNQITGKYGDEELVKDLYEYCEKNNFKFKLKRDDFSLLLESMCVGVFDEGDISYNQYKLALTQLINNISTKK